MDITINLSLLESTIKTLNEAAAALGDTDRWATYYDTVSAMQQLKQEVNKHLQKESRKARYANE